MRAKLSLTGKTGLLMGLSVACLVVGLTGCGSGDGLDRREVRGTILYDEKPVSQGTITLFPLDGGTVASGSIEQGNYVIKKENGPTPGEYRVEITGLEETGKVMRIEEPGVAPIEVPEMISSIPLRYNDQSELTLTVEPDQDVVAADFDLEK